MHIREATEKDNKELQELQINCDLGTGFKVSLSTAPDFFSRAKAYDTYKVFVACEGNKITGSISCAIRNAVINKQIYKVGYLFQAFTSPDFRKKGINQKLYQYIEDYMTNNGVALSYCMVFEDNKLANFVTRKHGYKLYSNSSMVYLSVYRNMKIKNTNNIRHANKEDLNEISKLLNKTRKGYDLYESSSSSLLAKFIKHTPEFNYKNMLLFEKDGEILACLGYWNKIIKAEVTALNFKSQVYIVMNKLLKLFKRLPKALEPGFFLKRMLAIKTGYRDLPYLLELFKFINNLAYRDKFNQIVMVYGKDCSILNKLKDFHYIITPLNFYIKTFTDGIDLGNNPIYFDAIDL